MIIKGIFISEYLDSFERLDETSLSPIEKFYGTLNNEEYAIEEYNHAENVWSIFKCRNLRDYKELYLRADVLILADMFENVRQIC